MKEILQGEKVLIKATISTGPINRRYHVTIHGIESHMTNTTWVDKSCIVDADEALIREIVGVLKSIRAEFRCCQKACIGVTDPLSKDCNRLIARANERLGDTVEVE